MSGFSSVDSAHDPDRLVQFLDAAGSAEAGIKHYVAAAHAQRNPQGPILDVGCGAGHDLALLASSGLAAVGVDPSEVMLGAAAVRTANATIALVRGVGGALPFVDQAFAGCRIERVLMHVDDPSQVLSEVLRCVEHDGLVTVFEPDWTRFEISSDVLSSNARWITSVKQPDIGARLWELLEESGCDVLDRVEELSVWRSLVTLERVTGFAAAVDRAVTAGRIDRGEADRWIHEQRALDAAGGFRARIPKVLVVAAKR
jgi:ubiquinone/menaquinone biosynthesis C-methylase UbiE